MSAATPPAKYAVRICGGDNRPGPRDECPGPLHDYPLPAGYGDAHAEAASRLSRGWVSRRCPACGLYGWVPWLPDGGHATRVPAPL